LVADRIIKIQKYIQISLYELGQRATDIMQQFVQSVALFIWDVFLIVYVTVAA